MNLIDQLKWRYATKKFDTDKKLSESQLGKLLEAVNLSASSYGLQPYEVFVVENAEMRQKLKEASYGQSQLSDASQVIVFAAKTNLSSTDVEEYICRISAVRNVPLESLSDFQSTLTGSVESKTAENNTQWAKRQVYIALGFLLVACAVENIDACPMEGFNNEAFDQILGLKEKGLTSVVMATVGFRSETDKYQKFAKVRKGIDELVTFM